MEVRTKDEIRLLAMGYLWYKTNGKASQEAMRSFSEGAAWAYELLNGGKMVTKEKEVDHEVTHNE